MKKLNNKGFAVSTILYSLILMVMLIVIMIMSTMASSRSNNRELIEAVEKELNGIDKSLMTIDNNIQPVPLPFDGLYRIDLLTGGNFYYWYAELNRNCTVTRTGSQIKIAGDGCNNPKTYSTANGESNKKISNIYNSESGIKSSIEFIGDGANASSMGKITADDVPSGNYYITLSISQQTLHGITLTNETKVFVLANNDTEVGFNTNTKKFKPNSNVWNISAMKDVYAEEGNHNATVTENGNRVLDLTTSNSLEISSGQIPISGSKIKADNYFSFDGPKKWNFEKTGTDQYYICNIAMDGRDANGNGHKCRRDSTTINYNDNGETLEVPIDPLVLTYVPDNPLSPIDGGTIEFRKICTNLLISCDSGIKPEYQKFTLYKKS